MPPLEPGTPLSFHRVLLVRKLARYSQLKVSALHDTRTRDPSGRSHVQLLRESQLMHEASVAAVTAALQLAGCDVRTITVDNLSARHASEVDLVVSAGGDGTFLRVVSHTPPATPVLGINTDPGRSTGQLCSVVAPQDGTAAQYVLEALHRLERGEFEWQVRRRIRATFIRADGTADESPRFALNEVFIAERDAKQVCQTDLWSGSARVVQPCVQHALAAAAGAPSADAAMHLPQRLSLQWEDTPYVPPAMPATPATPGGGGGGEEQQQTLGPLTTVEQLTQLPFGRHKSSGIITCTGTGSTAWMRSATYVPEGVIARVMRELGTPVTQQVLDRISRALNGAICFPPHRPMLRFLVREPILRELEQSTRSEPLQGDAECVVIRGLGWDTAVSLDGLLSVPLNYGDFVVLDMPDKAVLRTVVLDRAALSPCASSP